ncbi:MAG: DUF3703 domain-containing protein [Deltaproteobacteria bacterium]|nr:MAG: DUF3703 domain-containing protein [Deltaproteobacteria bacterium]
MNEAHVKALEREIALARDLMRSGKHDEAFVHLERAHVLGQEQVRPHVLAHWLMLKVAVRRRDPVAAFGQAARIVLGALGSAGMPIDPELLSIMQGRSAPERR